MTACPLCTTTGPDGTYTITGLPAGSLRTRFVELSGAHRPEYFDDSPDYDHATPLTATPGTTTPDINAALTPIP